MIFRRFSHFHRPKRPAPLFRSRRQANLRAWSLVGVAVLIVVAAFFSLRGQSGAWFAQLGDSTALPTTSAPVTTITPTSPEGANTPQPSRTPRSSPTAPRPTASTVPTATPTPVLHLTSDLLFLSGGNLMRWDYVTNHSTLLVSGVSEFSVSASGRKILLTRPQKIAAAGVEQFEISLLDFETKQMTPLLEHTRRLYQPSFSPDGHWVAYTGQGNGGKVSALNTALPEQPVELGLCIRELDQPCSPLAWSADSRALLWTDERGIWTAELGNPEPRQVIGNRIEVMDPKGGTSLVEVSYQELAWSPAGRYALVRIVLKASDVRWYGLLDIRAGRLAQIPDSYERDTRVAYVGWLQNGALFETLPSRPEVNQPSLNVFQVVPTRSDLLLLSKTYPLEFDMLPTPSPASESYLPAWPVQIDENHLAFGFCSPGSSAQVDLLVLDLKFGELEKIGASPTETEALLWSPDGEGALALHAGRVTFISTHSAPQDLLAVLGTDAHAFTWLPPAPRS